MTFLNASEAPHQIASAPHPGHIDCPQLNAPALEPGDRYTVFMNDRDETCGFHDELDPDDLQGTITVGAGRPR